MLYIVYILSGLAGGVLTGMAGLTAAMVLTQQTFWHSLEFQNRVLVTGE